MDKANERLTAVLAAEERRRQALLSADLEALQGLLADTLVYVHSTAASDSKDSYLAKLRGACGAQPVHDRVGAQRGCGRLAAVRAPGHPLADLNPA